MSNRKSEPPSDGGPMPGEGVTEFVARIAREQTALAISSGYESTNAMVLAESERELRRERRELVARRRREIVDTLGGRLTDDCRDTILSAVEVETDALRAVRAWHATLGQPGARSTLVLSGGPGTGKTVAALCYVAALAPDRAWQFVRAVKLGSMFERWSNDRDTDGLRLAVPLLILDDFGQEPLEDRRVIPAIHELLDARKSASRTRTIITTNLTLADARSRYPAPDISRLAESASWVVVGGPDMRRST